MINGEIKEDELTEALRKRRTHGGRVSTAGHRLTREVPIGKGALQARQIGATGMAFGTQNVRSRGKTNDILANLKNMFEQHPEEADDDEESIKEGHDV